MSRRPKEGAIAKRPTPRRVVAAAVYRAEGDSWKRVAEKLGVKVTTAQGYGQHDGFLGALIQARQRKIEEFDSSSFLKAYRYLDEVIDDEKQDTPDRVRAARTLFDRRKHLEAMWQKDAHRFEDRLAREEQSGGGTMTINIEIPRPDDVSDVIDVEATEV